MQVFSGTAGRPVTATQQEAMQHGVVSEIHSTATLCSVILPFLGVDAVFHEEGFHVDDSIGVSPDGSLRSGVGGAVQCAIETKCPTCLDPSVKLPVQYAIPQYYMLQCLFEAKNLHADYTLYVCWSKETTTVFRIPRQKVIEETTLDIYREVFESKIPRRPSKGNSKVAALKALVAEHITQCEYLGEFPSVRAILGSDKSTRQGTGGSTTSPWTSTGYRVVDDENLVPVASILQTVESCKEITEKVYQLTRVKASQVVVLLISNMDRNWSPEVGHSTVIGYFLRGYSLATATMRRIREKFRKACHDRGIYVPMSCSDGEWHSLMTSDDAGVPLTEHQLSKQVWSQVMKLKKNELITTACSLNHVTSYILYRVDDCTNDTRPAIHVQLKPGVPCPLTTPAAIWFQSNTQKQDNNVVIAPEVDDDIIATLDRMEGDPLMTSLDEFVDDEQQASDGDMLSHEPDSFLPELEDDDLAEVFDTLMNAEVAGPKLSVPNQSEPAQPTVVLTDDDRDAIVEILKRHDAKAWSTLTSGQLSDGLVSAASLNKVFRKVDLVEIIRYLNIKFRSTVGTIKLSLNKPLLINELCQRIGDGSQVQPRQTTSKPIKAKPKTPSSLGNLATAVLRKKSYPVHILRISMALATYDLRRQEWFDRTLHIPRFLTVQLQNGPVIVEPYYRPPFSKDRQQVEIGKLINIIIFKHPLYKGTGNDTIL